MSDLHAKITEVQSSAQAEIASVSSPLELESFRVKYLGTKGLVKDLTKLIGQAPPDQKREIGAAVNGVRDAVTSLFESKQSTLGPARQPIPSIDITEPGIVPEIGHSHLITRVTDELTELFARMGFTIATGPELEDDWHNFVALNIPASHPARDPLDNFYLAAAAGRGHEENPLLLRTQTSTVQVRVMETTKPPIRCVVPGRVYRPDTTDATHLPMFHQLEALVIDQNVTMVDLKSTILQFVRGYFGENTRIRFRPSFFPFTEPSAEVDVWFEDKQKWIELGGCGMVHPNVLRNCGLDPEAFSGWAFGFGIERIAMRRYGVSDIRLLVENDLRFLGQF